MSAKVTIITNSKTKSTNIKTIFIAVFNKINIKCTYERDINSTAEIIVS